MKSPSPSLRRRALGALILAGPLCSSGLATWSIVALDRSTGEVAVASATCIENANLRRFVPILRVGEGAAAAQSFIDPTANNKAILYQGFLDHLTPTEILFTLEAGDPGHQTRQYGIVSFEGPPLTFTGSSAGHARGGVTGVIGDIEYAIQGNVLAGEEVFLAAEVAFRSHVGDLSQRIMAGMEAARAFGGDGRCSCGPDADGCGAPPPSFEKSSHIAFIIVSRIGDENPPECPNSNSSCVAGATFFLNRNVSGDSDDPEPIFELQALYDEWREGRRGHPDHIRTRVDYAPRLVADGSTSTMVTVQLADLEGVPLASGGQTLHLRRMTSGASSAVAGPLMDLGNGQHAFTVTATDQPGVERWRIVVEDTPREVTLHPPVEVVVDPLSELHVGYSEVSASEGADVPFVLNRGPADAARDYLILGSASGTTPGTPIGSVQVPLNTDRLLVFTLTSPGAPRFPGSLGELDADGRAEATFRLNYRFLTPFVGTTWNFAAVLFGDGGADDEVTDVVGFEVVP